MANSINYDANFNSLSANSIVDNTVKITDQLILNASEFIVSGGTIDIDAIDIELLAVGGHLSVDATGSGGAGGDILITATDAGASGGDIFIIAVDVAGNGGTIQLNAVDTSGTGGNITMGTADVFGGGGGRFTVQGNVIIGGVPNPRAGLNTVIQSTTGAAHFIIDASGGAGNTAPDVAYSDPVPVVTIVTIGNDHCGHIQCTVARRCSSRRISYSNIS